MAIINFVITANGAGYAETDGNNPIASTEATAVIKNDIVSIVLSDGSSWKNAPLEFCTLNGSPLDLDPRVAIDQLASAGFRTPSGGSGGGDTITNNELFLDGDQLTSKITTDQSSFTSNAVTIQGSVNPIDLVSSEIPNISFIGMDGKIQTFFTVENNDVNGTYDYKDKDGNLIASVTNDADLSTIESGTYDPNTGIVTFTRQDNTTFEVMGFLINAATNVWFNENTNFTNVADGSNDFTTNKNVGIGVNNVTAALEVSSDNNVVGKIINTSSTNTSLHFFNNSGAGGNGHVGSFESGMYISGSGISLPSQFFVSATGDVGIGTTDPERKLHITGNSVDGIQMLITPNALNGQDAGIEIRGSRNATSLAKESSLIFSNFDNDISESKKLGRIAGVVEDNINNTGGVVIFNSLDGVSEQETIRFENDGEIKVKTLPSRSGDILVQDSNGYIGKNNITDIITTNSGQIKLNWTNVTRPSSGGGFIANTPKDILLNQNYTVSSSPTTTYPYLALDTDGGEDVIDTDTNYLRELKAGQSIIFRVKVGYVNKGQGQNGNIVLRMFNSNPSSGFDIFKSIPAPDNTTSYTEEFEFIAIADSLSLNPLYGYAFEGLTSFSDSNLEMYIENITAFYQSTEIDLK